MKTETLIIISMILIIISMILITGGSIYGQGNNGEKDTGGHQEKLERRKQDTKVLQEYINYKYYNRNAHMDIADNKTTTIVAIVTAYAPFDNQSGMCNDGDPTSTSTGTYPKHGTLAADPERLPYGTEIYIPGYGLGIVEDTGGALRNDKENIRIDIFVDTYEQAISFGKQELVVEVRR